MARSLASLRILIVLGALATVGGSFLILLGLLSCVHSNHATCCHVTPSVTERLEKYFKTAKFDSVGTTEFLNSQEYRLGAPVPDSQLTPEDREMIRWKLGAWLAVGAAESWQDEVMSKGRTIMIVGGLAVVLGISVIVAAVRVKQAMQLATK
ncbi:MAG: hypothetical protein U0640_00920 [Phycisphaerales bacterium]